MMITMQMAIMTVTTMARGMIMEILQQRMHTTIITEQTSMMTVRTASTHMRITTGRANTPNTAS